MTIIEVCQELECDYRIIHEVNTDGYMVNGVVVKSPANDLMFNHNLYLHLKATGEKNEQSAIFIITTRCFIRPFIRNSFFIWRQLMNEDDIRQIQEEYEVTLTGVPKAVNIIELAKRYGVSQQTIRKIAKGQYKKKVNTK